MIGHFIATLASAAAPAIRAAPLCAAATNTTNPSALRANPIPRLFDRAAVRVEHAGVLPSPGQFAHAVIQLLCIARFQFRYRPDSQLLEILQHLSPDAAQILQLPFHSKHFIQNVRSLAFAGNTSAMAH
jgi:hypothetical protein